MTLYPLEDHTAEELAKLAEFEAAAVPSEVLREQVIAAAERAIIDRQAVADTNRPLSARSYAVAAADAALAVVATQPHPAVQRVEALADELLDWSDATEAAVADREQDMYWADQLGLAMGYRRSGLRIRRALAGDLQ